MVGWITQDSQSVGLGMVEPNQDFYQDRQQKLHNTV